MERSGFIDPNSRKYVPVAEVPGFTRGLDFVGNLAFVGLSQVRESAVFSGIPITERLAENERTCGVCVIDLTSGQVIALLRFETAVQEVFAVTVLPGRRYPDLINEDEKLLENSFVVPDAALADVSVSLRAPADPMHGVAGAAIKTEARRTEFIPFVLSRSYSVRKRTEQRNVLHAVTTCGSSDRRRRAESQRVFRSGPHLPVSPFDQVDYG